MPLTDLAMIDEKLFQQMDQLDQLHVLRFWDELTPAEQTNLASQLSQVDWHMIADYRDGLSEPQTDDDAKCGQIAPPAHVVRAPKTAAEKQEWARAYQVGEEAIRAGKVAAILLAGGQGTRLGFESPKGLFPIGPVSGHTLFQLLAEQAVALTRRYNTSIPYLIMTSDKTHEETISFFETHQFFGLNRDDLYFFQQGFSTCVDVKTGKLLLVDKSNLQLNPDGHGGILAALLRAGLYEELKNRGVEYLFSHQIDNPLAKVCDPAFIGLHILHDAQVSTKVVAKTCPEEKVGIAADLDGKTSIIEYSDLSNEMANERDSEGELKYWAGSTAIHVFNREFVESVAAAARNLPWHRAIKKVPCLDEQGQLNSPEVENGVKFERFLFDTLPMSKKALIVETIRSEEFAPLKNRTGDFSPDYVREKMVDVATKWLRDAGIDVPAGATVEISPQFALTPCDVKARAKELASLQFDRPVYISPEDFPDTSPR